MKKIFVCLALSCMIFTACNSKVELPNENKMYDDGSSMSAIRIPEGGEDFYIGEAIELTKQSAKLAESEELISMYTQDSEVAEQIATIASVDYDSPKSIRYIYLHKDKILEFLKANYPEDEPQPDFEKIINLSRFSIGNFATMLNARFGAKMIAATAVLNNSKGYIKPADFDENFAVFLEYDGEFSSVVSFNDFGENVISAQVTFVKNSDEQFEMMLDEIIQSIGEESITVEEATITK